MVRVSARVQVTVEIAVVSENWNDSTDVGAVHREAREKAVKEIERLCQRYVRLIGTPVVQAILTEEKR